MRDLGTLFEASEQKGAKLPAVILLDDAQWLGDDESNMEFMKRLLENAKAQNWPVLLVATHWQKEWHQDLCDPAKASLAKLLTEWSRPRKTEIVLGKEPDLRQMIRAGFPGLTHDQLQLVLDKAGGNPRLMDEMLRYMLRKRAFFEGRDISHPLTERGVAQIDEATFALHDLIADRLAAAPEDVRRAVGLASLQGERFLDTLVALTAESLAQQEPDAGLSQAERPHSFIFRLAGEHSEFAQRVFMEVAREQLDDILDADAAEEALRETLVVFAGGDARFKRLNEADRDLARQVTIYVLSSFDGELVERERHCLADCYAESIGQAYTGENDFLRAHELMRTAIATIRSGKLSVTDFSTSDLSTIASLLAYSGDSEARTMVSDVMIRRLEAKDDDSARHFSALADAYSDRAWLVLDHEGGDKALPWSEKSVEFARRAAVISGDPVAKRRLVYWLFDHLQVEEARKGYGNATEIEEELSRIALDLVRMALRDELTAAIIYSQDQDLNEVVSEIAAIGELKGVEIKLASAFPTAPDSDFDRGIMNTQWLRFDKQVYDRCIDEADHFPRD